VPNIKNVQSLSLLEVQAEILKLMDKAKKGALTAEDLSDGTISISNIGKTLSLSLFFFKIDSHITGTIGGTYTAPLILPP
jgi:2-oxoisovalerate dehydrogenase E2 component (dihydrolipoyl transacylase)